MALGFGSNRKVARLEVEVAGDTEDFDKSMEKVRRESKKTGEEASHQFNLMKASINGAIAGLSVFIGVHLGRRVPAAVGKASAALSKLVGPAVTAGFTNATARVSAFAGTMSGAVAPAVLRVVNRLREMKRALVAGTGFTLLSGSASRVAVKVGAATAGIAAFARILANPAFRAASRFAGLLSKALFGAFDLAAVGARGLGKGIKVLGTRLREEGKLLSAFGIALQGTGSTLERVGKVLGKVIGLLVKFKIGTVLASAAIGSVLTRAATNFGNSFARVESLLLDLTEGELVELRNQTADLRRELGVTSDELNNTFYQTLSAMPELAGDATKALDILSVALKVSTTGFADGETAIRAITGIMNAWKLETSEAIDVADALFAAQNQGVTTFQEIAESIGSVTGLTSALGGDWRDLLGIIATVSPFIETGEVMTGFSAVLAGVLEASPKAVAQAKELNLEFNATRLAAIGVIPFLTEIIEKTEGDPEIIAALFGRKEATQLVVTLAQNMDSLATKMDEVTNAAGTTEAILGKTAQTSERASERVGAAFSGLGEVLGRDMEQVVIDVKNAIAESLISITDYIDDVVTGVRSIPGRLDDIGNDFWAWLGVDAESVEGDLEVFLGKAFENRLDIAERYRQEQLALRADRFKPNSFGAPGAGHIGSLPGTVGLLQNPAVMAAVKEFFEPRGREGIAIPLGVSQDKIAEYAASLEAVAKIQLHATGDQEAYAIALDDAREAVNQLVIAEHARMIASGAEREVAAQLLSLYTVETDLAAENAENAAESLNRILATGRALAELGIDQFDEQSSSLSTLTSEYATLDTALKEAQRELVNLGTADRALREETEDYIVALHAQRTALIEQIGILQQLSPLIEDLGANILELTDNMNEVQEAIFLDTLKIYTEHLRSLTAAQEAYTLAVREFGEDSDEAKDALVDVQREGRRMKALLQQIQAVLIAAGLDITAVTEALALLEETAGGPGLDPTKEGFWKWIIENADTMEGIARGMLSVGDALGVIGDRAKTALQGVVDLTAGLGRIAAGDSIGGIAQTIGGVVGIGSSLVGGESAESKAARETVKRNTEALRKLTNSIDAQRAAISGASGEDLTLAGKILSQEFIDNFLKPGQDIPPGFLKNIREEFEQTLKEMGLTFEEFADIIFELTGVQLDETGLALRRTLTQAAEALKTVQIEDYFKGFTGSLENLRRTFEIMDIDEAVDQLDDYVKLLKEFSGLDVPDFDLSTPEGRAALDEWVRATFEGADALTGEQLGQLSIPELLDLFGTIEGLIDAVDGGPDAESFQEFRGITEITANRLAGLLTTDVYWNEITAQNVRAIVALLGGTPLGAEPSTPAPNYDPSRFPGPDISREPVTVLDQSVTIQELLVEVSQVNPDMDADELAGQVVAAINTELGNGVRRQVRATGGVTTRTAR